MALFKTMISNYLKIAWRTFTRNRTFSAINIMGLALGMACSLLIFLWVKDERSVDGFHANGKSLYQLYQRNFYDGKVEGTYYTQGLLAEELKRKVPEIQYASSLEQKAPKPINFQAGEKIIKMDGSYAGADFFTMFSYPVIAGNATAALTNPGSIAISRKMAEAFYGGTSQAIGKIIRFENKENLLVAAVFENVPANSSQQFDFLRGWKEYTSQNAWLTSWGSSSPYTFIQLRKDADPEMVQQKIRDFISQYTSQSKDARTELLMQSYPDKYLHSTFKDGYIDGGRIEYVRLFSIIAVFILLIACINFMNLSTARSAKRAREVGIRKVVGAVRSGLIGQFVGEAMLLTFLSTVVACVIVLLLMPGFNSLTGKQLFMPVSEPVFWISVFVLLIFTGFVAGSYPALFLSSLNPISVLKGRLKFSAGSSMFRKGLVVFQFALSILLIIGMIVIYRQIDYTQSKNLGYDRENLVYVPIEGDLVKGYELFKARASVMPGILNVSKMKESPTVITHQIGDVSWSGKPQDGKYLFSDAVVGYDFVKTMNLQLVAGRDYSRDFGTDSTGYILNETAVEKIGYADPIGKPLTVRNKPGTIIGVLRDFHFTSMHETIQPLVIRMNEEQNWGTILVRTKKGQTKEAVAGLEKLCREINPDFPFTYQFSDEEYTKLYKSEQVVSKLATYFAFLAIFISCLGLFGLATFTAEQRIKEIGVRKVLGASFSDIIGMLSINFLKPVFISMVIAFPVSWLVMNKWLKDFAYKINIEWWIFAVAGLITVGIALLTVSFQSIRSALVNPIDSLKTE